MVNNTKDKIATESVLKDAVDAILGGMDNLYEKMKADFASKKDVEAIKQDLGVKIDSLDRKFDAQQSRLDRHDKRVTNLEEKATFLN
jgi:hypothetical protein